jgi:hypothetical protein
MCDQSEPPPIVLGYPGFREGHGLGTDAWRHTSSNNLNDPNSDDDKLWEILNELAENDRILNNKIALLHEQQQEQQQIFMEARYANSPSKPINLNGVMSDTDKSSVVRKLMWDKSSRAGKSRRVFRKNTKITRRRNKKANRSHRRRRTSHVAKQT